LSSDAPAPISSPAKQATPSELNAANSAAPSAGTIMNGSVKVSSWMSGAASTPNSPAITVASTLLDSDSQRGDKPAYIACGSLSAAARVASPNWEKRYSAHRIVDRARAAVEDDHGHGQPGDQGAFAQAEQGEQQDVLHLRPFTGLRPGLLRPGLEQLPLPAAVVDEELVRDAACRGLDHLSCLRCGPGRWRQAGLPPVRDSVDDLG
jgi:hypothetical protein